MKDDRVYLLHIQDAIQRVMDYTCDGREFFMADLKTQDAVIRNIEIIGEATKNLSAALKGLYPGVPWKQIAGMCDTLIHRYFGVKLDLVWQVVENDLSAFRSRIQACLENLSGTTTLANESKNAPTLVDRGGLTMQRRES